MESQKEKERVRLLIEKFRVAEKKQKIINDENNRKLRYRVMANIKRCIPIIILNKIRKARQNKQTPQPKFEKSIRCAIRINKQPFFDVKNEIICVE